MICCKGQADEALAAMRGIMRRLKLTVNEEKTRVCRVPQEYFDFLGYTFGRCYSVKTGRAYLGTRPSKRSVQRLKRAISEATHKRTLLMEFEDVVGQVNRMANGWANYFCLGPVSRSYRGIDGHIITRIRRWIFLKHKKQCMPPHPKALRERMGVICMTGLTKKLPWANA